MALHQDLPGASQGIDLAPFGWQEILPRLDIPENTPRFKRLSAGLAVVAARRNVNQSDGESSDVMMLATLEKIESEQQSQQSRFFEIVDGILMTAGVIIFDATNEVGRDAIMAVIDQEAAAGILAPSPDDARALLNIAIKIAKEDN